MSTANSFGPGPRELSFPSLQLGPGSRATLFFVYRRCDGWNRLCLPLPRPRWTARSAAAAALLCLAPFLLLPVILEGPATGLFEGWYRPLAGNGVSPEILWLGAGWLAAALLQWILSRGIPRGLRTAEAVVPGWLLAPAFYALLRGWEVWPAPAAIATAGLWGLISLFSLIRAR
ncbi:MAG TPA: hypothetical protein PLI51_09120 [bacterium]|nr:hypothetical protein [bacterium]HPQ66874.1 hypothetical protein [bacterium]